MAKIKQRFKKLAMKKKKRSLMKFIDAENEEFRLAQKQQHSISLRTISSALSHLPTLPHTSSINSSSLTKVINIFLEPKASPSIPSCQSAANMPESIAAFFPAKPMCKRRASSPFSRWSSLFLANKILPVTLLSLIYCIFLARIAAAFSNHVPPPPRNVQVTQINSSTIKVSWEPSADEQAEVLGYNVYKFQILNDAFVNNLRRAVAIVDRNKLYAYLNDLEPNTEYAIRVGAFNMKGDGELSQLTKQSRILTGGKPPSPPRPQSISLINEFKPIRAKVEWLPPRFTYNLPLKRYILWWKPVELEAFQRAEVQPTEHSFVLDHLYSGQEYELHIAAVNEVGASENATEQLITPTAVPDGEPLNIRYTIFRNKLSILWDPPQWRHRNGNITHYEVELMPISSRSTGPIRRNVSSQTAIFDIDPAQSYTFRVAAATSKGTGIYSGELRIDGQQSAAISPPKNVRVQTVSNASVVVQWDFDEADSSSEAGQPDGFMVKYVPEPMVARESSGMDKWRSQPVMDPKARHLEINRLITQKSYAFCVLAMKQRRLGPCSDPPITLVGPLRPTFVVQNLRLEYKTSQSVKIRWDYHGPAQIGFYIKQMGQKSYLDQDLVEKSMVSPQFEKRINGSERELFLANLRPFMNYTFQVGVFSLEDGRHYWPRELQVQTDPRGPPFVEAPEFIQSDGPNTAQFRLSPASEEYGPISHYWLIVVPGNYSKEEVTGADKSQLQIATRNFRTAKTAHLQQLTVSSTSRSQKDKKLRRDIDPEPSGNISSIKYNIHRHHQIRQRRHQNQQHLQGIYIAAQLPTHEMQRLYREELTFTLGDGLEYDGYMNFPLDPDVAKYHLMSRAFARDETWRRAEHPFDYRPPMQEPVSKMHTDSALSEQFSTRVSSLFTGPIRGGGIMFPLLAVGIILFVMAVMIGMLFLWWFRCKRGQSMRAGGAGMHKVPLTSRDFPKAANGNGASGGGTNGALPTETSKLLLGMDQDGRPVMNSFDRSGPTAGPSDLHDASSPLLYSDTSATLQMDHHHQSSMGPMLSMSSGNLYGGIVAQQQQFHQHAVHHHHLDNRLSGSHLNVASMPIQLAEFATHIDRQKMANNQGFIQEFESIDTGQQFTWENSAMEVNKHKNRYANVVAYDHSRVILPPEDDADEELPGNDYINANYIDGYDKPKAYIATQGPLPETFADFWRMIWEERVRTIVMLTRLEERSRTKCDQYWPTRGTTLYGNYKITLMETTELAHYCLRTLRLENVRCRNDLGRDIQHCQFTAWPDHGVPIHPTPFLIFLKRVKALHPVDAGPIVTHCSAGIGRTGAFIVIDWQLERLRYENSVDIYGCVRAIRSQRQYMVQTDDQYIFIHDALLDAAQSGSTEIPSSKLLQHVQTLSRPQMHNEFSGIDIEFNTLLSLKPPKCFRAQVANAVYNGNKNVKLSVVPWDFNRVELPREAGADGGDYINASWIDGYRSRNAYIATQIPLANTVADFWRMLWSHDCSIIAMLARQPNDPVDKFYEYWPSPGYPENYNGLIVDFVSEFDMTHYWVREFKCTDENRHSRTIRQFQFIDWADDGPSRQLGGGYIKDVPQCPEKFVDFVRQVHQTKQQFGSTGPICVHCLDGAGRTGTFCAVALTIDRAKLEHVVDMFTTVKLLRMQRPQMVENREQYEFCYQAAIQFLAGYDEHY